MYTLGIDLGTTYTAAATRRADRVEVVSLGGRAATIPSVVLRRDDGSFLVGEPAVRRGLTEPDRLAREFKRRFGDPTPLLLGGVPHSPEALTARLLRTVVDTVSEREGGPPESICVTHPANWGPYKTDLLRQAATLADLGQSVTLTTEPEAAAVAYARQQRVDPGAVVAVYDLGGGTFDAAVLRRGTDGFSILGRPEGVERLGGADFDAAVFAHVRRALGDALPDSDDEDPALLTALARLQDDCVAAKEALSDDTDTTIPVLLPEHSTTVRLTRAELEEMVRPALHDTIEALRRALRTAEVDPAGLHSVLLVGGSSRMPVVAQQIGATLDRPVTVDAHPKYAVAVGAAWTAASAASPAAAAADTGASFPAGSAPAPDRAPSTGTTGPGSTGAGVTGTPGSSTDGSRTDDVGADEVAAGAGPGNAGTTGAAGAAVGTAAVPGGTRGTSAGPRRWPQLAGAGLLAAALLGGGAALVQAGGDGGDGPPPDEECTDTIRANPRWVCLTGARVDDQGRVVVQYDAEWAGAVPDEAAGYHLHLYGGDGTRPDPATMGRQADDPGAWHIEDADPGVIPADEVPEVVGDAPKVCARIANGDHELVPDTDGGYRTGNCTPLRE